MPIRHIKRAAKFASGRTRRKAAIIHSKFKEHASTAMIAAFSFLIALAWKDVIVKLVQNNIRVTLLEKYPYLADLITAIIVTIIAIIAIAVVSKWAQKPENENK